MSKKLRDKELGDLIRALRVGANQTQQALADKLGVQRTYVTNIEKGYLPNPDFVARLCRLLLASREQTAELVVGSIKARYPDSAPIIDSLRAPRRRVSGNRVSKVSDAFEGIRAELALEKSLEPVLAALLLVGPDQDSRRLVHLHHLLALVIAEFKDDFKPWLEGVEKVLRETFEKNKVGFLRKVYRHLLVALEWWAFMFDLPDVKGDASRALDVLNALRTSGLVTSLYEPSASLLEAHRSSADPDLGTLPVSWKDAADLLALAIVFRSAYSTFPMKRGDFRHVIETGSEESLATRREELLRAMRETFATALV